MRIAFVTGLYLPSTGGLEILTSQLSDELVRRGHDVCVLTSREDGALPAREVVHGIEVIRDDAHEVIARRDLPGILRVQREAAANLREYRPDVIHAHDAAPTMWMYLRAVRRGRPPVLLTLHNVMTAHSAATGAGLEGLRAMLRAADWVTGVARRVVDDAVAIEPSIADRVSVVTNGVARPERPWSPVGDGADRLLCLGRLVTQKGFERALAVTRLLVERRPTVRLTIAGDGPERPALARIARELGLEDRVELLGDVPYEQVPDLLTDATVVMMPSRFEGLPLVALEAAWMARPVVASAVPGLDDAIVDGSTGLLVDGDDVAFAAAVERLLADRDRAAAMGRAARAHVEASFSLETCVDRYEDLYRRLVAAPTAPGDGRPRRGGARGA